MVQMLIYKVLRMGEWAALREDGIFRGSPDDLRDGFIHFSAADQLAGTLARHFAGEDGLMLVACDTEVLGEGLQWDVSRGGARFPHLYRSLEISEIAWTKPVPRDPAVGALLR